MGLDGGGRRICGAISDETHLIATPLQFVERGPRAIAEIQRLIDHWQVGRLVIGMPTGLSGREGPQAAEVREFAAELKRHLSVPIEFWDERLTTAIAERSLIESGYRREARRSKVDAVAAAVILQGYLDRQRLKRRT
jgi:putative Holliday junction resolvase